MPAAKLSLAPVHEALAVFAVGFFDDVLVECEGTLLFQKKTVVCDSSRIDTLLVIPI